MSDPLPNHDEAVRYVLGELNDGERRAFEAQLDESETLRAQVRELEEGALAVALTVPRRRPPAKVWQQIEQAVTRDTRRKPAALPAWWIGWWRSGWAVATGLGVGLIFVLWANRADLTKNSPPPADMTIQSPQLAVQMDSAPQDGLRSLLPMIVESNRMFSALQTRTQEMSVLRQQVTALEGRLTRMSQSLTQQQALLSETNRLKFFQLGSVDGSGDAPAAPLSPRLQQALFMVMARELGWQPPVTAASDAASPGIAGGSISTNSIGSRQTDVDFVDLRVANNSPVTPTTQSPVQTEPAITAVPPSVASASTNAVPGFVSGDTAFMAFDSSVAPVGSTLTFGAWSPSGEYFPFGNTVLNNNPLVIAIPNSFSGFGLAGFGLVSPFTVTATLPTGEVISLGPVSSPPVSNPP